jgi:hypothetical protein
MGLGFNYGIWRRQMKTVWIVWGIDEAGTFIAGIYDHKVRAEEDLRVAQQDADPVARYWIQEKAITK